MFLAVCKATILSAWLELRQKRSNARQGRDLDQLVFGSAFDPRLIRIEFGDAWRAIGIAHGLTVRGIAHLDVPVFRKFHASGDRAEPATIGPSLGLAGHHAREGAIRDCHGHPPSVWSFGTERPGKGNARRIEDRTRKQMHRSNAMLRNRITQDAASEIDTLNQDHEDRFIPKIYSS